MYRARTLSRFQSGAAEVFSKNTSAFSAAAAEIALEDQAGRHGVVCPAVHLFLFSRRVQDRVRLDRAAPPSVEATIVQLEVGRFIE